MFVVHQRSKIKSVKKKKYRIDIGTAQMAITLQYNYWLEIINTFNS